MKKLLILALGAGLLACGAQAADPMEAGFARPPEQTKPWCYWYWISDNLSREGITKDAPLLPAGLLGPVSLQAGRVAILEGKL